MAIFTYEARRLRYGRTLADLRTMTLWGLFYAVAAAVALFLIVVLVASSYQGARSALGTILGWMLFLSLADKFIYDFVGLTTGLDSIRTDYNSHRWPLIAVSDMSMNRIVAIKYLVVQIATWRTMLLVVGLRLSVVVLGVLNLFVLPLLFPVESEASLSDFAAVDTIEELLVIGFTLAIVGIIAVVYVIEPRWRLRALSAASLLNSLRGRDASVGLMWSVSSFLRLWLVQIMIGIVAFIGLSLPSSFISFIVWADGLGVGLLYVLYTLAIGAFIRYSYRSYASARLREVYHRLVKDGGGR